MYTQAYAYPLSKQRSFVAYYIGQRCTYELFRALHTWASGSRGKGWDRSKSSETEFNRPRAGAHSEESPLCCCPRWSVAPLCWGGGKPSSHQHNELLPCFAKLQRKLAELRSAFLTWLVASPIVYFWIPNWSQ